MGRLKSIFACSICTGIQCLRRAALELWLMMMMYQKCLWYDMKESRKKRSRYEIQIWQQTLVEEQQKLASQIVTKHDGSATASEIVPWMSEMIHEGDIAVGLPKFKGQPPPLMPEELQPT